MRIIPSRGHRVNGGSTSTVPQSDSGTPDDADEPPPPKQTTLRETLQTRLEPFVNYCKTTIEKVHQEIVPPNSPENPPLSRTKLNVSLCPPYGPVAIFLTKFLTAFLLWLILYAFFKDDALPGGNLFALTILMLSAIISGFLVALIGLPPLLGMMAVGLVLRNAPVINVATNINPKWSSTLRNIALTVILLRAGLGLDGAALKKLKTSVLLLSFLPCLAEVTTAGIAAHFILNFPWLWAFLLGCVLGAVSPAILVPFMLKLQAERLGTKQGIPSLLMAASSLDDVLAISGFGVLLSVIFAQESAGFWATLLQGPLEMAVGLAYGGVVGCILWFIPHPEHEDLSVFRSFFLVCAGLIAVFGSNTVGLPGSGALGALTAAFVASHRWRQAGWDGERVKAADVLERAWTLCQPVLFGLIGAEVDLTRAAREPAMVGLALVVLVIALVVRMLFTGLAVSCGADLNWKERLFVAIAWLPKATVQAAVGSLALDTARSLNVEPEAIVLGEKVVMIAVLAILISAPLGAVAMSLAAPRLLQKDHSPCDVEVVVHPMAMEEEEETCVDIVKPVTLVVPNASHQQNDAALELRCWMTSDI